MGLLAPLARWRARRVWLRDPARALALLNGDPDSLDAESASIRAWLLLTYRRDPAGAEAAARAALPKPGDTRFAPAPLAEGHTRRRGAGPAVARLPAARAQ